MMNLFVLVALFIPPAHAATPQCQPFTPRLKSRTLLPEVPVYYFRPLPESGKITASLQSGASDFGNRLLNLETGEIKKIPGPYDAVPSPDGHWLIAPYQKQDVTYNEFAFAFYPQKGLEENTPPLFIEGNLPGSYPSFARTGQKGGATLYRVMVLAYVDSKSNFLFQDYQDPPARRASVAELRSFLQPEVDGMLEAWQRRDLDSARAMAQEENRRRGWTSSTESLIPQALDKLDRKETRGLLALKKLLTTAKDRKEVEDFVASTPGLETWPLRLKGADYVVRLEQPKRLCSNFPMGTFRTPMISKDGTRVATLDRAAGKSFVYDLDPATGACRNPIDLGRSSGKADFSPDGRRVAYHTQAANLGEIVSPSDGMNMRPYVRDLATGAEVELGKGMTGEFMFAAFHANGDVVVGRYWGRGKERKAEVLTYALDPPDPVACGIPMHKGAPAPATPAS